MKKKIEDIKRKVVDKYPMFGSLVDCVDFIETRNSLGYSGNPTAGCNSNTIYYHPDFIDGLTDGQDIFVFAHELCHIAFDHMKRGEGKDQEVWNIATDAVINAFLKRDGLEMVPNVVDIKDAINYDAEELYKKLMKEKQNKKQKSDGKDNSKVDTGHDTHQMWNENSIKREQDKAIGAIKKEFVKKGEKKAFDIKDSDELTKFIEEVKGSIIQAFSYGNTTNSDEVTFESVGEGYPLLNWPMILKRQTEVVEYDWSYENAYIEDGIISASLDENSYKVRHITEIVLDTSSSISDDLLRAFLRECKNILNFSDIKIGCFDVKFYGFKEIKNISEVDNYTFVGRGGTNFEAAINAFSKNANNKIIFTDGDALMPSYCKDVIWIVFGNKRIKPPGGKVYYIDPDNLIRICNEYKLELKSKVK